MSILTKTCNQIVGTDMGISCNNDPDVSYPTIVVFGEYNTAITSVAEVPTPAEVQTYLTGSHGYLAHVTNGSIIEPELTTKSGADTYTGAEEVVMEMNGISVTFKKITNDSLTMFRQNTLNNQYMRMWWVDSNGRWYGGKEGYIVPHYIPEFSHAGYGEQAKITRTFKWQRNIYQDVPISQINAAYLALYNDIDIS